MPVDQKPRATTRTKSISRRHQTSSVQRQSLAPFTGNHVSPPPHDIRKLRNELCDTRIHPIPSDISPEERAIQDEERRQGKTIDQYVTEAKHFTRKSQKYANNAYQQAKDFATSDEEVDINPYIEHQKARLRRQITKTGHEFKKLPREFIRDAKEGILETRPKQLYRRAWQETEPFRQTAGGLVQNFEEIGDRDIGLERSPYEDTSYIESGGAHSRFQPNRASIFHRPKSRRPGNLHRSGIGSGVGILGTGFDFGYATNPSGGIGKSYRGTGLTYSTQPQRPPSQRSPLFGNFHHISSGNFGNLEYGAPKQYPAGEQNLQMQQSTQLSTPPEPPQRNNYGGLSAFTSVFGNGNQLASNGIYKANTSELTGGSFGQLQYVGASNQSTHWENESPDDVANGNVFSGFDMLLGAPYRSPVNTTTIQETQSENKLNQDGFFPIRGYTTPKKTQSFKRNAIRPSINCTQGDAGIPPIPPKTRIWFPALRNQFPQLRQLTDDQIWIFLLRLRISQMQAGRQNRGYSGGYDSGLANKSTKKFTGISSGLYKWS